MTCIYIHNGIVHTEKAYKTLLGHLISQYGAEVDVTSILNTLNDNTYRSELMTSPRLQGKNVDGEIKYDSQTKQPVSDKEYSNFVDKGTITNTRIESILGKVQRGQHLTPREQVMFYHNIEVAVDFFEGMESQEASTQIDIVTALNENYTPEEVQRINELMADQGFQDYLAENDIEQPDIQEILRYFNEQRAKGLKIDNDTLIQINLLLSRSNYNTVDELYGELYSIFYDGQVRSINIDKLNESTLFNVEEKNRIINDTSLQAELSDTILAVGYDLMRGETSRLGNLNKIEVAQELLVLNPNETTSGLTDTLDPGAVFNQLADQLAGVATMDSLESKIQDIEYNHIKEQFRESERFREFMFNLFSQLERVPVFKIVDGTLGEATTQINSNDVLPFIQQGNLGNTTMFISAVNRSLQAGEEVWSTQIEQIRTIIKAIEKNLATFNIDIVGLSERIGKADLQNIVDLLFKAKNLAESVGGEFVVDNTNDFVEAYNTVFGITVEPQFSYSRMDSTMKQTAVVKVTNPMGQAEMFENFGLIKIGENTYHRVQRGDGIDTAYSQAIQLLREGHFWVPPSALPGFLTKNNKISIRQLQDTSRTAELVNLVKVYIAQQIDSVFLKGNKQTLEEMMLWSRVFGYDMVTESVEDRMSLLSEFDGDRTQLIENFPQQFKNFVLQQKLRNTKLYNQVLQDFQFTDGTVSWNPSSEYTQQLATQILPQQPIWNDYKNYAAISQEGNLASVVPTSVQIETSIAQERVFYTNFPEALKEYNGELTSFDNTIVIPTNEDLFIKKDGIVYEKVIEDISFGKSIYMAHATPINDGFFHTDNQGAPKNQPSLTSVRTSYNIGVEQSRGQINKLSSKEKSKIDKKIDEC